MSDSETSVADLKEAVRRFIDERCWGKYHSPKNIAESICIEAAELLEIFQWKAAEQSDELRKDRTRTQRIKEELSDVFIYCLSMANSIDIELSTAVLEKLRLDEDKYPPELYRGKAHLDS